MLRLDNLIFAGSQLIHCNFDRLFGQNDVFFFRLLGNLARPLGHSDHQAVIALAIL